jgi:hypothetical protein
MEDEIPPLNLGWNWGRKQIQPKNPTPRRSSSMDVVLAPLTMNTKIQTQKKKWCPGSRIQVCDMQNALLSQPLKNLSSEPTIKNKNDESEKKNQRELSAAR